MPKINPRISEKAILLSDKQNVYVFNASPDANKRSIAALVKKEYKVTPLKVNVANREGKKKAYVYLKKGDKIEIV